MNDGGVVKVAALPPMAHLAVPLGLVVGYASGVVTEDFDGLGIVIREQRRHEVKRGTLDKLAAQVSDAQLARGIFSLDAPLFLNLSAREPVSKSLAGSSDRLPRLVRRVEKAIQVECLKLGSCPSRIDNDPGLLNGGIQIAEGGTSQNQFGPAFRNLQVRGEAAVPGDASPVGSRRGQNTTIREGGAPRLSAVPLAEPALEGRPLGRSAAVPCMLAPTRTAPLRNVAYAPKPRRTATGRGPSLRIPDELRRDQAAMVSGLDEPL